MQDYIVSVESVLGGHHAQRRHHAKQFAEAASEVEKMLGADQIVEVRNIVNQEKTYGMKTFRVHFSDARAEAVKHWAKEKFISGRGNVCVQVGRAVRQSPSAS